MCVCVYVSLCVYVSVCMCVRVCMCVLTRLILGSAESFCPFHPPLIPLTSRS